MIVNDPRVQALECQVHGGSKTELIEQLVETLKANGHDGKGLIILVSNSTYQTLRGGNLSKRHYQVLPASEPAPKPTKHGPRGRWGNLK